MHPAVRAARTVAAAVLPNGGRVGAFASDGSRRFTAGVDYSSLTSRVAGTSYTNGGRRRIVHVAYTDTTGIVCSYTTTIGGTALTNKQWGGFNLTVTGLTGATVSESITQNTTFEVDPGAAYSVTCTGTKVTWVEVDL